mgnify:CR=1 FL=1
MKIQKKYLTKILASLIFQKSNSTLVFQSKTWTFSQADILKTTLLFTAMNQTNSWKAQIITPKAQLDRHLLTISNLSNQKSLIQCSKSKRILSLKPWMSLGNKSRSMVIKSCPVQMEKFNSLKTLCNLKTINFRNWEIIVFLSKT